MSGINTKLIHGNISDTHRSLRTPVYLNSSFDFETSVDVERAFRGETNAYAYSRISNPTVTALEERLNALAGSNHCLCFSSGMAAITNTIMAICESGDNIITCKYLFGNTYSLFARTLKSFGIEVRFVNLENNDEILSNINNNTRAIFFEAISNPQLIVFDIEKITALANEKKVLTIIDTSLLTPYLFNSKKYGIDIEIMSTTKFISGGATSVGGAVLTYNSAKWENIPKLKESFEKFGHGALHKKLYKEVYRNFGACLDPHSAYLQTLALETLTLRIDRICYNASALSQYLDNNNKVHKVEYSTLRGSKYYSLSGKYFNSKPGCLVGLWLNDKEECYRFMDALKIVKRGTNLCDNKSMIIHPASTIYCDFSDKERVEFRITDNFMRLAVGLEDIEDLIADVEQALETL